MVFIEREEREELNALSKDIFGVSSKWQKILDKGSMELITRTVVETIPGENGAPDTTKETVVPVLVNGVKQFRQKYYNLEEVRELLLKFKAQKDDAMAKLKAMQEQQALEKKIQEQAGNT